MSESYNEEETVLTEEESEVLPEPEAVAQPTSKDDTYVEPVVDPTRKPDLTEQRDNRCIPLAQDILQAIGNLRTHYIGNIQKGDDEAITHYANFVSEQIIPLLRQYDIRLNEVNYVFALIKQCIALTQERIELGLETLQDKADAYLWKVDDVGDVTFSQLMLVIKEANSKAESNPQDTSYNTEESVDNTEEK